MKCRSQSVRGKCNTKTGPIELCGCHTKVGRASSFRGTPTFGTQPDCALAEVEIGSNAFTLHSAVSLYGCMFFHCGTDSNVDPL